MQQEFHQHIKKNFPGLFDQKSLLAISGGIDSVVLAHLCQKENLEIAFAHCNFQLRGADSDRDEDFVRSLANKLGVDVFVKKFETEVIADKNGQSIQIAARELRYKWFDKICAAHDYEHLLTAHHLNDDLETFFINLLRGTGLEGLTGIPAQNNHIIRPLLIFTRRDIAEYAEENDIKWREDYTNASDDYLRNRLRHHIIPALEKENSKFTSNFLLTQSNLKSAKELIEDYRLRLKTELSDQSAGKVYFDINKIKAHPHSKPLLYQLLKGYGFSSWDDIYALLTAQPGKQVLTKNYRLLKDRDYLILGLRKNPENPEIIIDKTDTVVDFPEGQLICEKVIKTTDRKKEIGYLAADKIMFPLKLRVWQPGDVFRPLGMKGHRKISDFLKDEKLSLFEKENTYVLLSNDKIIWVVGQRIADDYKVEGDTTNILKIEFIK